jgi:hypothetical protein
MTESSAIVVTIDPGLDLDSDETERLVTELRTELLQLDVDAVQHLSGGEAPEGTRSIELIALGSLLVKLGPGVITAVAGTLQAWLARDSHRKLTIQLGDKEITLDNASDEERRKLIDAFIGAPQGHAPGQ